MFDPVSKPKLDIEHFCACPEQFCCLSVPVDHDVEGASMTDVDLCDHSFSSFRSRTCLGGDVALRNSFGTRSEPGIPGNVECAVHGRVRVSFFNGPSGSVGHQTGSSPGPSRFSIC